MNTQKHLIFEIDGTFYGLDIQYVLEISGNFEILPITGYPDCVLGTTHLREMAIPVIDIERLMGYPLSNKKDLRTLIISEYPTEDTILRIAFQVDNVFNVAEYPTELLQSIDLPSTQPERPYLHGVIQDQEGQEIRILNIHTILTSRETNSISEKSLETAGSN